MIKEDVRNIKVLHIGADNIGYGGRSNIAFNLSQNMDSVLIKNDFLSFKKIEDTYEKLVQENNGDIKYVELDSERKHRIRYEKERAKKIGVIIRREKYDIVHIHADHAYEAIKSAVIAKKVGIRYMVLHAHSVDGAEYSSLKRMIIALCRFGLNNYFDFIVGCSEDAIEYMTGRQEKASIVIKNGINIDKFAFNPKVREQYRELYSIRGNFLIGTVGRLCSIKNYPYLFKIMKEYLDINKDAMLMIAGDGDDKEKLVDLAKKEGIYSKIIWLGKTDNTNEIYQCFDVFVLTSEREGFGIVNIEAQAAGVPCLVSDCVPDIAKVCDDFEFLSIKENPKMWAEKIEEIRKKRTKRVSNAEIIKRYGYDIVDSARQLQEIYMNLVYKNE